jgi:hypothetical protein
MIRRLVAFGLLALSTPSLAADYAGTWALRSQNTTIFQFDVRRTPSGWTAVWVRPTSFEADGQHFSKVSGPSVRRVARVAHVVGGDLEMSFDDPRPGAVPDLFRLHLLDARHATADYVGAHLQGLALVQVPRGAPVGGWKLDRTYDRVIERSTNAEMTAIFDADQKARQVPNIDWSAVGPQDEARRKRTQALLDAGALNSGDDFFHAAFVFQHGGLPDDYLKAHLLATVAVARGSTGATWIAAATLDRYLQNTGKPQILGTQFHTSPDGRTTQEPFNRTFASDALRDALGVPNLSEQEKQRRGYEKAARQSAPTLPIPALQHLAPSPPAKVFSAKLEPSSCSRIPGSDHLLGRSRLRWVLVGEILGTNEAPKAFGDLVCLASSSRPVVVALEQVTSEQPAIDAFIGSDGGTEATARFLMSRIWTQPVKDGRSSNANFDLFRRLRELRAAGRITSVVAFQPVYDPGPAGFRIGAYENALAASLLGRVPPGSLTLALVGNIHAMRTAPVWAKPPYVPMAGFLPVDDSVTLEVRWNGGSYWACTSDTSCGPQTMQQAPSKLPLGITTDPAGGLYTGALNLGVEATPSLPKT